MKGKYHLLSTAYIYGLQSWHNCTLQPKTSMQKKFKIRQAKSRNFVTKYRANAEPRTTSKVAATANMRPHVKNMKETADYDNELSLKNYNLIPPCLITC